jgi:succinylglutamic semialdehyde dehydrogenase
MDKQDQLVAQAVVLARASLETWSATPIEQRRQIACAFAEQLKANKPQLSLIISEETGKPRWESGTEVDAMIGKVALSIRAMDERRRPAETVTDGVTAATRYKPHGVIAVLGPFNFPGHLPNGHIVPALLAGNAVVFKPSEHTPRIARRMAELWAAAGLPSGVLSVVEGGPDVGEALIKSDIDGVFFTGSFAAGRAINRALADHPGKIAALEMGGNNALVVHRAQDLKAAAYLTIQSAYLSAGQRCSCARRLIVVEGEECARFIETLVAMIKRLRVGLHTDMPEPFMGPVINEPAAKKLLEAQKLLLDRGARPIVPMSPLRGFANLLCPGLIDVTALRDRDDEELFGPLLQVIRVRDFVSAIAEANNTRFGLAAGLLSDNRSLWDEFYAKIRAGVVNWNRPLTGASSALPFGGVGDSGNHRPSAYFAVDYCSYPVASLETDRVTMPAAISPGIEL